MFTEKVQWLRAVPSELISSNEVHVWRLLLNEHNSHVENIKEFLSADELERAGKFHFEKDQHRFLMARGVLRIILANYLGKRPDELRFDYNSFGKPALADNNGWDSISFNLSHSGEIVLYAVSCNRKIGIDVERIQDSIDVRQIANRFFSIAEISSLDRVHKEKMSGVFFQYWTRKEALFKAVGDGISFPMEHLDVSLINGNFLSPIILPGENGEKYCWHVQDLFPGDGYTAAIATEGGDLDISCWHYSL